MPKDAQIKQIRVSQIILSGGINGGTHPNLGGIFYSGSSATNTTGSFESGLLNPVGQDVSLFFSGAIAGTTGKILFGGDITISGSTILQDATVSSLVSEQPISSSGLIISQDSQAGIFLSGSESNFHARISADRPSETIIEATTGSLYFLGGQRIQTTDVNVAIYTLTGADEYYIQNRYTTTAAAAINLPKIADITDGRTFLIKDSGGDAGTNNLTINQSGSDTIEGSASAYVVSSNSGSLSLISNSTTSNWEIFGGFNLD